MSLHKTGISNSSKFMNAIIDSTSFTVTKQSAEHVVPTGIQLESTSELQAASESCSASSPITNEQSEASSGQSQLKSEGMEETIATKYGRGTVLGGPKLGPKSLSEQESKPSNSINSGRFSGISSRLPKCGGTRAGGKNDPEGVAGKIENCLDGGLAGCQTGHEAISSRRCWMESTDAVSKPDPQPNDKNGKKRKQSSPPWKCSIVEPFTPNPEVSKVRRLFTESSEQSRLDASYEQLPEAGLNSRESSNELLSCSNEKQDACKPTEIPGATGDVLWRSSSFKPRQVLKRKISAPVEDSRSVHAVSRPPAITDEIQIAGSESFSTQQKFSLSTSSGSAKSIDGHELSVSRPSAPTIAGDTRYGPLSSSIIEPTISGGGGGDISVKTSSSGSSSICSNGSSSTTINGSSPSCSNGSSSTSPNGLPSTSTDGSCSPCSEAIVGSTRSSNLLYGQSPTTIDKRPSTPPEQPSPCTAQSSQQSSPSSNERHATICPRPEAPSGASSEVRPASSVGASTELPATGIVGGRGGAASPAPSSVLAERQPTSAAASPNVASGQREGEATPTLEAAKCIQAIDRAAVHRICSGQVVVNLATAVKELVENSLDAGSSSVEVRLTDHGASSIVVSDDGPGVHPNDFEALALKHHTSKLRDFSGVCGIATYGFRGEALSSLCALSSLSVCTRHASQPLASLLTYDRDGKLMLHKPASRQIGTTVTLNGLFSSLPVRRREFERNLKKEYHKMLQVLYSYAVISTNIRLQVVNQSDGRRNTVLSTSSFSSVRDNIEALFGTKQMKTLLAIQEKVALGAEDGEDDTDQSANGDGGLRLEGFISSCAHGDGRSAADRQFYFVNSRPCDPVKVPCLQSTAGPATLSRYLASSTRVYCGTLPPVNSRPCDPVKVSRLVNEVYHTYNRHQCPFVVLNILMERRSVDVNLTPDKRQVMMHNEKLLLTTIKNSLLRLYEDIPNTLPLYNNTCLVSSSQKHKSNSAPKQPKLFPKADHDEVSTPSDTLSHKNILTSNSLKHTLVTDNVGINKDDTLTSDWADSVGVGSSFPSPHLTAHTVGVNRAPSQALSRRLHVSKNSPGLAIVSAHADKGNEASCRNIIRDESPESSVMDEMNCSSDPLQPPLPSPLMHTNTAPDIASQVNTSLPENTQQIDSETLSLAVSNTKSHTSQNTDGRPVQNTQSFNSCNIEEGLISRNTKDQHVIGHELVTACTLNVDTDLDTQISCRNYDTFMSSSSSKRDNSFEEFLPSPKKKSACFHLKRNESKKKGSIDSQSTDLLSETTESPEGSREASPCSDVVDDTYEKPVTPASSKRSSLLHEATASFLARLASSKAIQARKTKSEDGLESDVRKSLRKFVYKAGKDQEEHIVRTKLEDNPAKDLSLNANDSRSLDDNNLLPNDSKDTTSRDEVETLVCYDDTFGENKCNVKTKVVHLTLDDLRESFARRSRYEKRDEKKLARNFHAKIAPSDNRAAEAELNKVLSKDMFAKMKILGQFNLGFLITKLKSDLFIIDQHATDEKYNFETLQQTCILRHQPLIQPQSLQLTPANETVLIDNIDIFSANGFQFDVDESLPFGERVKLKSVPQSRNWSFGKDDIDELIFMLSDSPGAMYRPSRVRAMFASRACRTSVMVGTALSRSQMRDLVDHMGQIEQPWNCPHGRPTVRHLVNLDMISK
ncbi:DNA mismatch repair protein family [Trinorchestia longiramus]|nr:DNA mismatch repair protein family [Trinorchestia longiramus]